MKSEIKIQILIQQMEMMFIPEHELKYLEEIKFRLQNKNFDNLEKEEQIFLVLIEYLSELGVEYLFKLEKWICMSIKSEELTIKNIGLQWLPYLEAFDAYKYQIEYKKPYVKARELYIHIGLKKTGTTAIQDYCVQNFEHWQSEQIIYPTTGRNENTKDAHHYLALPYHPKNAKNYTLIDFDENIYLLKKECSGNKKIILSSEVFSDITDLSHIERYKELAEQTYVILYLREPSSYILSLYGQAIKKADCTLFLDEFIKKINMNWIQTIDRWQTFVGEDHLLLQVYGNNSVDDFLDRIQMPSALRTKHRKARKNESWTEDVILFKRLVNSLPLSADLNNELIALLFEYSEIKSKQLKTAHLMTDEQINQLAQEYQPTMLEITQRYFENTTNALVYPQKSRGTYQPFGYSEVLAVLQFLNKKSKKILPQFITLLNMKSILLNQSGDGQIDWLIQGIQSTIGKEAYDKMNLRSNRLFEHQKTGDLSTLKHYHIQLNHWNSFFWIKNCSRDIVYKKRRRACLELHVKGKNPYIELKKIRLHNIIEIKISLYMQVPLDTKVMIYYKTVGDSQFGNGKTVEQLMRKEEGCVDFMIKAPCDGVLRIDIGRTEGIYLIRKILVNVTTDTFRA